ncbi:hypothetical protein [Mycobacterium sp. NPDC050041]|uniref:hypothetical protein n=1 Tax=Mycobacterium sp. NPDC050041 TaxID=3364293 RepID=UPI003C2E5556
MTGPEDNASGTRPISVAELLAKNGTIGAPPVGGRRRRRRGNSDSVTVAELTGEIPIISDRDVAHDTAHDAADDVAAADVHHDDHTSAATDGDSDVTGRLPANGTAEPAPEVEAEPETPADEADDAEADYAAHLDSRNADPDPVDFQPPRKPHYAHALRHHPSPAAAGAEDMSPDPAVLDLDATYGEAYGDDAHDSPLDLADPAEADYAGYDGAADTDDDEPSYMRGSQNPLFGGQSVADDIARGRGTSDVEDLDLELHGPVREEPDTPMAAFVRGAWIVGQCILAVVFGAGLFVAFDQLWKWNNIVALVLSVLVILGLVVGVRVVRKTEDIGSTLIAVAVGALVTLGPLALLQSG